MGQIPLTNTVNITVTDAPKGLGEYSTNSVCLFTNEQPLSVEPYIWATNAQDIINEYGSNSKTAKMAVALFSPAQNLRTGNGQVLVFPYTATDATFSTCTTTAIENAQIQAFKIVQNGILTINIDGQDYIAKNLNFASITSVNDIVTILKGIGLDCDIAVVETNKIQFKSRIAGATGNVTLKDTSNPQGTDLNGSDLLNGANSTQLTGVNVSGTKLTDIIPQAEEIGYFGAILTAQVCDNANIIENATYINTTDHIYFEGISSLKNIGVLGAEIKESGLSQTRLIAYSMSGAIGAKRAIASYATIALSTNYSGVDTALTMNLKELTGIAPDTNLSQTYYNLAKQYGVDIYGSTEGLSCVYSFSNGDYTDEATNTLWLKKALEVSGFNYLRKTNTKIPQTEAGMTGLKNAYESRCIQGVRNGVIGVGLKWNDSIPFGDPADFARNIEEKGYYIYSLPIAEQQQSEREERIAPVIQIAIKLSGAIHSSNVIVNIQK